MTLKLDSCIKCSICVAHCPVAAANPDFSGPKQNGPDIMRFRLSDPGAVNPSVRHCSNCKNCDLACPSGVRVSAMNLEAKALYTARKGIGRGGYLLARPDLCGRAASLWPGLANRLLGLPGARRLAEKRLGVSAGAPVPGYSRQTFPWLHRREKDFPSTGEVVYFPGCFANYHRPEVGLALMRVLRRSGYRVLAPGLRCCGTPLMSGGMLDEARRLARENLRVLGKYAEKGLSVVTTCPSCYLALKSEYREILGAEGSGPVAERVVDALDFLLGLADQGRLDTGFSPLDIRLDYHQPCHQRAAGIGVPALRLLKRLPGVKVRDLAAGCCGLSGSCGLKRDNYPVSVEIGREVFRAASSSGAGRVVTECGMCGVQIGHGAGVAVEHPVEVIARAYGREPPP